MPAIETKSIGWIPSQAAPKTFEIRIYSFYFWRSEWKILTDNGQWREEFSTRVEDLVAA